jgi:hypothetical protein
MHLPARLVNERWLFAHCSQLRLLLGKMGIKAMCRNQIGKIGLAILCGAVIIFVSSCSPAHNTFSQAPSPTPTPVAATARLLVSDNTSGTVNVVDATTDLITKTIAAPSPGKMVSAGGTTLIQSTLAASVAIFDNATETIRFNVILPAQPVDIALTPNGQTAWVAENNGTVQSINTATSAFTGTTTVAGVQRLVMGPLGTTVLAFSNTDLTHNVGSNSFVVILPSPAAPVTIVNSGLDHPANGIFAEDDNHFLVLNCGPECGGVNAGIVGVVITNTAGASTLSAPLVLSGATVGQLSGTTAFVAGSTSNGLNAGTLQVINSATLTAGSAAHIADGQHSLISLTSNGRLYIGSTTCTLGPLTTQNLRQGCLTIFDTVAQTVTPVLLLATRPNGDVTGLAPVAGRNVIYVVQGGVVDIFDISTNAVSTTATAPSVPGTAFGVVQLNP